MARVVSTDINSCGVGNAKVLKPTEDNSFDRTAWQPPPPFATVGDSDAPPFATVGDNDPIGLTKLRQNIVDEINTEEWNKLRH